MAQAMLNMLQFNQSLEVSEAARSSIFSLLAMVRGQAALPGRKTILYFTEGLRIPTNLDTAFQSVISFANRANVTFYSIDARGLLSRGDNSSAMDELRQAAAGSQATATDTGARPARRGRRGRQGGREHEGQRADGAAESPREHWRFSDRQHERSPDSAAPGSRRDRKLLRDHLRPGHPNVRRPLHRTSVRLLNSDAKVQARSGYFALPPGETMTALHSFETPLLKALGASPLPKDVTLRSSVLRLDHRTSDIRAALVVEVPLKSITFAEDQAAKSAPRGGRPSSLSSRTRRARS